METSNLDQLRYDANGLVYALVVDEPGIMRGSLDAIRMLGYMNQEALNETMRTGKLTLWSRARQDLWRFGSVSGGTVSVNDIRVDRMGEGLIIVGDCAGPSWGFNQTSRFKQID